MTRSDRITAEGESAHATFTNGSILGGGYPPDKQEQATRTVLEQAELICTEVAPRLLLKGSVATIVGYGHSPQRDRICLSACEESLTLSANGEETCRRTQD